MWRFRELVSELKEARMVLDGEGFHLVGAKEFGPAHRLQEPLEGIQYV